MLSEQKKIRPPVTDFTVCRHLFAARHAIRRLPHNRISRLIAAHTCLLDFAIAVQTTVQTKCICVYTAFTIEYQRVASKSAECRQKHKYWQTRARAREYHVHTTQRRNAQVCFQRHKNASYERKCVTSPKINRCSTYHPLSYSKNDKPCPPTTDCIK